MIPHFVQEIVGNVVGMPGIFISCVFSASLSTVSVSLNMLAGIIYTDFIRPLKMVKHSDRNANRFMKLTIALLGVLCVLAGIVIEKLSSNFQAVFILAGMCNGAIVGAFTLGMLYPWANRHVSRINDKYQTLQCYCVGAQNIFPPYLGSDAEMKSNFVMH